MAKIVILMGRGNSGKTRTIKVVGRKLGLRRDKRNYPRFISLVGEAEIYAKTSSFQEKAASRLRKVLAQLSSPQEKYQAVLAEVLRETQEWIDFLNDKPNAVAIIPFTLRNGDAMRNLIIQPLQLLRGSTHDIKLIYLKKDNINQKTLVASVVHEANIDKEIQSLKDDEERQANELLSYLSLRPVTPIVTHSLLEL